MNAYTISIARLQVRSRIVLRRLLLSLRRDPLSRITSPSDAIHLADQMLASTAVAHPGIRFWCSVAVEPLATLILAGSAAGGGQGIEWVRTAARTLLVVDRDDPAWDEVQATCGRHTTSGPMLTALPRVRHMGLWQRRCVTSVMVTATAPGRPAEAS